MDNLTHSLVGVALSRAFFKNRVPFATTALVLAANAPDLDLLAGWRGIRYIEFHRGVAHSLLALPLWALFFAAGLRWWARRRKLTPPAWWLGLLLGLAGVGSHLLLDLTNAYGIRLLAPLSQRWYAWDWMPIADPWLWLILLAFLGFPMLLGLIGNEVGAKRNPHRVSGCVALALMLVWWGFRRQQHQTALDLLDTPAVASFFDGQTPRVWAALPTLASPWVWQAVVDLPRNDLLMRIDTSDAKVSPERSYLKPPLSPVIERAQQTRTASIFLNFARFPLASVALEGGHSVVTITDLRFAQGSKRPDMGVTVELGPNLGVLRQSFTWE